jgi:Mycolic acid cyclopropane synthetase
MDTSKHPGSFLFSAFRQRAETGIARLPRIFFAVGIALLTCAGLVDFALEQVIYAQEDPGEKPYIAPFVPTPHEVVERMLELAEIKPGDILYDLGSGDGRIVIAAASKYGIKAIGFELDPSLVKKSRDNIQRAGLEALAEIHEQDIRTVDLSAASVLTLYLYPGANLRLRQAIMSQLKPGARVISHDFAMGSWKPDRVERVKDSFGLERTIYLWRIKDGGGTGSGY